jgi:hypothetical protein
MQRKAVPEKVEIFCSLAARLSSVVGFASLPSHAFFFLDKCCMCVAFLNTMEFSRNFSAVKYQT